LKINIFKNSHLKLIKIKKEILFSLKVYLSSGKNQISASKIQNL